MMIVWIDCIGSDAVKHDFDDNKEEEDSREIRPGCHRRPKDRSATFDTSMTVEFRRHLKLTPSFHRSSCSFSIWIRNSAVPEV
jgi:hypothetical protein